MINLILSEIKKVGIIKILLSFIIFLIVIIMIYEFSDDMKNITAFIKSHKELNDLPFLVVFRTIQVLREKGLLKGFDDVDRVSK